MDRHEFYWGIPSKKANLSLGWVNYISVFYNFAFECA